MAQSNVFVFVPSPIYKRRGERSMLLIPEQNGQEAKFLPQ